MALDKQAFYSQYAQVAIEQQKRYGIPASITLAQMGLESGFGHLPLQEGATTSSV